MGAMGASGGGQAGGRRGGRRRRGGASRPMAEINITPFVDVMLVLLIIFMVAAPLLTAGVPLRLPETAAKQLPQERQAPLAVSIDGAGRIFLEQEELTLETLPSRLAEAMVGREDDRVYLRADSEIGYGQVMQVMGQLNANGFGNIGLVTNRANSGAAPSEGDAPATPEEG